MLLLILTCILPTLAIDYGITVGGVKVTSDNMNNIKGSAITSGSVTYSPSSKRLTLNNVEITYTTGWHIQQCGRFGDILHRHPHLLSPKPSPFRAKHSVV